MRNFHVLLVGRTGSGKTTLAKVLVRLTARAIILDRKWEYDVDGAIICYNFAEFARAFLELRYRDFTIVLRANIEGDWGRAMELARHAQRTEPHGPLVIVLEEASNYGTSSGVDETVRQLYNAGRHERISMLAIIQTDTDFHRVARSQSEVICMFYNHKLSGDAQRLFGGPNAAMSLIELSQEYTPWPEQGRNFLVYPPHVDLYETWAETHNFIYEVER